MKELFSEININGINIRNRIVMPPMVCFGWAGNCGFVTEKHLQHYEQRARGGTGLIILEAHCVSKDGRLAPDQLGIWSDEHIDGLSRLAGTCHKQGSAVIVQIHHAGLNTSKKVSETAWAPSENNRDDKTVRVMSADDIHKVQQDFTAAALRAKKAGLDGIELHGAHGYLISQFMSPITNKRTDEYGGSIENRMRFACEIVDDIKKKLDNGFILGYRMGGNEPGLEEGLQIAHALEKHGVDLLHVSSGIGEGEPPAVPEDFKYNWIVYCGTQIKKHVGIPVIAVNNIRTPEQANYLIESGLADFAAVGRGLLVDPEWADKAKKSLEINPCLKCSPCKWFKDGSNCPGMAGFAFELVPAVSHLY